MPIVLEEAPAEVLAEAPEKLGNGVEGFTDDLGTGCGDCATNDLKFAGVGNLAAAPKRGGES